MVVEPAVDWLITHQIDIGNSILGSTVGILVIEPAKNLVKSKILLRSKKPKESPSAPASRFKPTTIMEEAKEMLDGWYVVREDGEIVFRPPSGASLDSHLPNFRKPLLYIFAARVAYDEDRRETPKVSESELVEKSLFCDKEFLSESPDCAGILVHDGEPDMFELDCSNADKIAEYIR